MAHAQSSSWPMMMAVCVAYAFDFGGISDRKLKPYKCFNEKCTNFFSSIDMINLSKYLGNEQKKLMLFLQLNYHILLL